MKNKNQLGLSAIIVAVIIVLVVVAGGILAWQYFWGPKEEVKVPVDETADWETYRNGEYGFEIKYPIDWKVESSFSGRLGLGQTEFRPGVNPQVFSFAPQEIDLTKNESEISIYVAPPGNFTCPPTEGDMFCVDGQEGKIRIANIEAIMLEGKTTKYCPPEGREIKEIYFCKSDNYFRFYTTKQKENIFNQMLSTFRFINPVAEYFDGVELQYETEAQKENIAIALNDILNLSEEQLKERRYQDYAGKESQWDLPTLIYRHFVPIGPPIRPGVNLGKDFFHDVKSEEVQKQVKQILEKYF